MIKATSHRPQNQSQANRHNQRHAISSTSSVSNTNRVSSTSGATSSQPQPRPTHTPSWEELLGRR